MIPTALKICKFCNGEFFRRPRTSLKQWKKQKFCSLKCMHLDRVPAPAICRTCATSFIPRPRGQYFCSCKCAQQNKTVNPRTTRYRATKKDGKHNALHREVMESTLGRPLLPTEIVHHKNGNKLDNRPDNLEIMSLEAHGKLHCPPTYPTVKTCEVCGTVFTPHKTKRKRKKTCQPSCARILAVRNRNVGGRARGCCVCVQDSIL